MSREVQETTQLAWTAGQDPSVLSTDPAHFTGLCALWDQPLSRDYY